MDGGTSTFTMYYDAETQSWFAPASGYVNPIWQSPAARPQLTNAQLAKRWREIGAIQAKR
jgi:hypothetical protein